MDYASELLGDNYFDTTKSYTFFKRKRKKLLPEALKAKVIFNEIRVYQTNYVSAFQNIRTGKIWNNVFIHLQLSYLTNNKIKMKFVLCREYYENH
jgi:hypothetical protein